MKATAKKIENVKAMYNAMLQKKQEADNAYEAMWVDKANGIYNVGKNLKWCEIDDEKIVMEKQVKRAIKNLAKELGFEITNKVHLDYYYDMERVIQVLENQFQKAMEALHDIQWFYNEIKLAD